MHITLPSALLYCNSSRGSFDVSQKIGHTQARLLRRRATAPLQQRWLYPCATQGCAEDDTQHGASSDAIVGLPFLTTCLGIGAALFLLTASSAEALSDPGPQYYPVAADLNNLAQNEDFWKNLLRYGTYFFSVLLGTAYTALKPIGGLLKRPVTAVFTLAAIVGLLVFVSTTVKAMLGVSGDNISNDLDYLLR
eukprot:jgi/Botrbrau1/12994/Bobra.384_1s0018.1